MEKNTFLSIKHLEKIYPNGAKAVFDFNLDIEKNEFIVIVGPSGCGKSTTLRMIAGLEDVSDGDILLENQLINYMPSKDRNIAIVFQSYALYPQMNVYENIAFPLTINKYPYPVIDEILLSTHELTNLLNKNELKVIEEIINGYEKKKIKISLKEYLAEQLNIHICSSELLLKLLKTNHDNLLDELNKLSSQREEFNKNNNLKYNANFEKLDENNNVILEKRKMTSYEIKQKVYSTASILDLGDYLDRLPKELSGGQMQRVALGRAIVKNVPLFLMDEPLSNLDAKLRLVMRSEIVKLHNQINTTTIYVTHDQTEAMTMASRIVVMSKGFVQQIGTPEEIYNDPCNLFVGKFIGSPSMNILEIPYEDNVFDFSLLKIKMDNKFKKVHDEFYNQQMNYLLNVKNDFSIPEKAKSAQEKMLKILSSLSDEKNGSFVKKKEKTLYEKIKNAFSKKEIEDTSFNKEIDVCNKKIDLTEKAINSKHNIIVGIRPEKLKIRLYQENEKLLKNEVKVFVTVSELLGAEYNVHFNFLDKDMVCKFGVEKKIKVGDLLILTLDLTDALFFDPITGARIK